MCGGNAHKGSGYGKILNAAKKIDQFMADNEFYYSTKPPRDNDAPKEYELNKEENTEIYNEKYDTVISKATNGIIFVKWCLEEAGCQVIKIKNWKDYEEEKISGPIETIGWKYYGVVSEWEQYWEKDIYQGMLQPGDICQFVNNDGSCYFCIYAGNGMYWNENTDENIKNVGVVTINSLPHLVLRYIK